MAQIAPPVFLCSRTEAGAEILRWENIADNCGSFLATEIFSGPTAEGPFNLLANITDPAVTTFRDPNPNSELRFYFLRYRYNCTDALSIGSDTLDNRIPIVPTLLHAGVEEAEIVVRWLPSISPETSGVVVLEQTPNANIPLDTVTDANEFRLPILPGDPPASERSFLLVAIDPCRNDSPQGRPARPMALSGAGGTGCTNVLTLDVDQAAIAAYAPIIELELFVSVDGGAFQTAGTFPPDATTVAFPDANDGETLCFYLEAVQPANQGRARSEVYCQTVSFNQPVRDFSLFGAEVNTNGEIILQFSDDVLQPADLTANVLVTRTDGVTETLTLPAFTFTGGTTVVPPLAEPVRPGEVLRLRVLDDCQREVTTNRVAPIFLFGRNFIPGQNRLNWTTFRNDLPGDFTYSVGRAFVADPGAAAGAMFSQIADGLVDTVLVDDMATGEGTACYQISTRFVPAMAGAPTAIFRSNIVCVVPQIEVFLPNAFSPAGEQPDNLTFRPRFSPGAVPEMYSLQLYDRWGGLIFLTNLPEEGWAGDCQGTPMPAGVYLYQLQYRNTRGNLIERAGTVNLLR